MCILFVQHSILNLYMAIKIILPFDFLNFFHDFHQNPSKNNRNQLKTTWFSWKLIKIHQHIIKPDFSVSLRGHEGVSPEQRPLWPAEKMNFSISLQMNKKMCRNTLKQSKTIKLIVFERFWAQLSVFQPPIEPRQVTSVEPIKTTTDMAQKGHAAGILSVRMSLPPSKKCLRCFFDLSDIARPSFWASPMILGALWYSQSLPSVWRLSHQFLVTFSGVWRDQKAPVRTKK